MAWHGMAPPGASPGAPPGAPPWLPLGLDTFCTASDEGAERPPETKKEATWRRRSTVEKCREVGPGSDVDRVPQIRANTTQIGDLWISILLQFSTSNVFRSFIVESWILDWHS